MYTDIQRFINVIRLDLQERLAQFIRHKVYHLRMVFTFFVELKADDDNQRSISSFKINIPFGNFNIFDVIYLVCYKI